MPEQNIGQILQAFNSIESKIQDQNQMLKELSAKMNALEQQNKHLVQMVHQLQSPSSHEPLDVHNHEFEDKVTQQLRSIEDQSKKTMEMIKANGGAKKRAWP